MTFAVYFLWPSQKIYDGDNHTWKSILEFGNELHMGPFHVASQKNCFRHAEKFYFVKITKYNLSVRLKKFV